MVAKPRRLTGNLINLSDAFRRSAQFTKPGEAERLVKLTRQLAVHLTYYRGEPHEQHLNEEITGNCQTLLHRIADTADKAGLKHVILPFEDHPKNLMVQWLKDDVMADENFSLPIHFQDTEYKTDLSYLGKINRRYKTVLDIDVRGLAHIRYDLKDRWDFGPRNG